MTKRLALALTALLTAATVGAAGDPGAAETPELLRAPASGIEGEWADLFLSDAPGSRSPNATAPQPVAYDPPAGFCPETQCNRNLDCFLQQTQGVYECPWQTAPICLPCGVPITNCEGYCDCR